MKKEVLDEIREMCNAIDTSNSVYEIGQILILVDCLHYSFKDNLVISNLYEEVHKKASSRYFEFTGMRLNKQQEMDNFMLDNCNFFSENINDVDELEEYDINELPSLSNGNLIYILETFLEKVDKHLFDFYQKMVEEERIIFESTCSTSFTSLNNSNTMISLCEFNSLKDIMIFAHELGHAYYFYINNLRVIDRENLSIGIKEEIPARILEKKFIDYMYQCGVIEQASILDKMYNHLTYKHYQRSNHFDDLKYVIAADIANNVKEKVDITRLFKMIHRKDFHELIIENNKKNNKRKVLSQ